MKNEQVNNKASGKEERTEAKRSRVPVAIAGVIILVAALGLASYYFISQPGSPKEKSTAREDQGKTETDKNADQGERLFGFSLSKPAFAQFQPDTSALTPAAPGENPGTSELENREAFNIEFSQVQLKALEEDGFYLTENDFIGDQEWGTDDFADTYKYFSGSTNKYYREPDEALFISSDVALHLYHILIDRSFQKIEETKFQPLLKEVTESLFKDSITNFNNTTDIKLKETYQRLASFYLIPLVILDAGSNEAAGLNPENFESYAEFIAAQEAQSIKTSQSGLNFSLTAPTYDNIELDSDIYELAKAELELIQEANGLKESPLFTPYRPYFLNDYSQFKPRSHYTKNNILKSYFIAMMWYGRMGFSLDSPELTRNAIVITGQINSLSAGDEKIADIYSLMSSAIEFFVGEVDDLTPYEYSDMIKRFYGDNFTEGEFSDDAMLDAFRQAAIRDLPKPRIVSEAVALYDDGGERDKLLMQLMQFRFMGQRFTPDAYVLNNLTQGVGAPDPETGQNLPSMTTALMPVYIISGGNETVKGYINDWVVANAPDSDKIIEKKLTGLIKEFAGYEDSAWTKNIYWNWLNTYRSLLGGYAGGYPYFMSTLAWEKKNLGTVLGSYTELKHDTLLYAKQSYAELGGGGENPEELPPVPKGYVEADYSFWSRLTALADMTADGLNERGLMPEYFDSRYKTFVEYSGFYRDLVKAELTNKEISEDDFEKLRKSGHTFVNLASALPGEELTTKERRAGIIADIHTDAVEGEILYEATGKPYIIYVAVKDKNGARLTRGLAFKHFELVGPLSERYADEDWQKIVYEQQDSLPAADDWSQDLIK